MSKQYWHQRGSGKKSKFGSFKYTAHDLYERGILLSVNQYSPRQFDKLHVFISSNAVGVFTLEMTHPAASTVIGKEEMRMEDLLQAQFDNNVRLDLFDGNAAFNLNMLIHQINKSESGRRHKGRQRGEHPAWWRWTMLTRCAEFYAS